MRICLAIFMLFASVASSVAQETKEKENRLDKVEIGPTKSEREKQLEAWGLIGRPEPGMFPLMADIIPEDRNFPLPFGINVVGYWQQSDWNLNKASLGIVGDIEIDVPVHRVGIDLEAQTTSLKLDMWVFPFWNVFFLTGRASAKANLLFRDVRTQVFPPQYEDIEVSLDFSGPFYSVGTVFAGGYGPFFGSVDFTIGRADMSGDDSSIDLSGDGYTTWTAAPRIGVVHGLTQFWFGARYISKEERFKGTVPRSAGNDFFFDVELDTATTHYTFGLRTTLWDRWEAMTEFGFGPRKAWNFAFGYRF